MIRGDDERRFLVGILVSLRLTGVSRGRQFSDSAICGVEKSGERGSECFILLAYE